MATLTATGGKVFREAASGGKGDRSQRRRVLGQFDASDVLMGQGTGRLRTLRC